MHMGRTCNGCDGPVSDQFARVYGDNNNEVYRCLNCVEARTTLRHAGGAYEDEEEIERRMDAPHIHFD